MRRVLSLSASVAAVAALPAAMAAALLALATTPAQASAARPSLASGLSVTIDSMSPRYATPGSTVSVTGTVSNGIDPAQGRAPGTAVHITDAVPHPRPDGRVPQPGRRRRPGRRGNPLHPPGQPGSRDHGPVARLVQGHHRGHQHVRGLPGHGTGQRPGWQRAGVRSDTAALLVGAAGGRPAAPAGDRLGLAADRPAAPRGMRRARGRGPADQQRPGGQPGPDGAPVRAARGRAGER